MKVWVRVLNYVLAAGAAAAFAVANAGEWVRVDLGFLTVRATLPVVVFSSVILGMVAVLLAGLRGDLRTRRRLRKYRQVLDREG